MPGIIAKFGTPRPVKFREKGCDTEFSARVSGALYINEYDEAAFGAAGDERKMNLSAFAAKKIEEHLAKWDKDDNILCVDGKERLALMLDYDLMELGINGSSRIDDISITDESEELYQEQIMKPYREAKKAEREQEIEAADEPHGPLKRISYNLSSHGMMAGTSSGSSRTVTWDDDGTAVYRYSSYGGGKNFEREYKITPETAEKISAFVKDKRLATLSKLNIRTAQMFDNFTSATVSMTFDDSSIGSNPDNSFTLNCGPSGFTLNTIEDGLKELLDECEAAGECIKNEMRETASPFGNFLGMMEMNVTTCPGAGAFDGMKQAEEAIARTAAGSDPIPGAGAGTAAGQGAGAGAAAEPYKPSGWTCSCGAKNAGRFCAECGQPRPSGWVCSCGTENTGKFCYNCGQPKNS